MWEGGSRVGDHAKPARWWLRIGSLLALSSGALTSARKGGAIVLHNVPTPLVVNYYVLYMYIHHVILPHVVFLSMYVHN